MSELNVAVHVLGNQSPKKKDLTFNFNKLKEIAYNLHLTILNSNASINDYGSFTGIQSCFEMLDSCVKITADQLAKRKSLKGY